MGNGAAAAGRHQPVHGAHEKLGGIGQYRPPPNGDIHVYLRASLGLLLKRAPFSFQDRTGPFHFIIGSGQMHEGRRRRGDLRSSIGPYATLEACLVVAQRCAGDAVCHYRKARGKDGLKRERERKTDGEGKGVVFGEETGVARSMKKKKK